ncbi:MAG: hypothetical protein FJ276_26635 [Planctomycetes bacterium]|nr:hypothetical protein [Planctomycetota bacterium]
MADKYASDDPLPGGVEKYFETLIKLLGHVGDKTVDYDALVEFVSQTFPQAKGSTAMSIYLGSVGRLGLWQIKEGKVRLTPEGGNLLGQSGADPVAGKQTTLEIKRQKVVGYDELLRILHAGDLSLEEIHAQLQAAIKVEWKSTTQTFYRLSWLRSLGFVQRKGYQYGLTPAGHAIKLPPPGEPGETSGGTSHESPKPLEQIALTLADQIDKAAVKGEDGADLEKLTAEAFAFLGFDSQVIGGPGNPDVVLTAPMGELGYRVLIDTKSRSNGCIQQNDVNFHALNQHKGKAGADYMMVLGPDFSGGNLETWAQQQDVRLLRTGELRDVLVAFADGVIPLDRLETLFQGGGSTDETVLSGILTESQHASQAMLLARKVYDAVRLHQEEEGVLNAHSLFFILDSEHPIRDIEATVAMLRSDLIGALSVTQKDSLYTRLTPPVLENKLAQLQAVLGGRRPEGTRHS